MLDLALSWLWLLTKVVAVWTLVSVVGLAAWCVLVHYARMEDRR